MRGIGNCEFNIYVFGNRVVRDEQLYFKSLTTMTEQEFQTVVNELHAAFVDKKLINIGFALDLKAMLNKAINEVKKIDELQEELRSIKMRFRQISIEDDSNNWNSLVDLCHKAAAKEQELQNILKDHESNYRERQYC